LEAAPIGAANQGRGPALPALTHVIGVKMKLIGWAIALAAAGLTPAAAQAPAQQGAPAASAAQTGTPPAGFAQDPNRPDPATAPATPGQTAVPENALGVTTPAGQFQHMPAEADFGVPIRGGKGIQEQVTPIGREAATFHNVWLMITITFISIFVLALLLWVMIRYRRSANPTPSRNSHNTTIEVIWTLVPVLILVAIAIPSIRLLRHQYTPPPADLTIKVIGHQWYWTYEYPDHGVTFDSYMLKEANDPTRQPNQRARTDADGPPLLAVDERVVVPVGATVKFIVTADDVIHSFAVPAFWLKMDANPGQLNETWAKIERPGVYFGQCSELCGARHAYMPVAVEAVPPARFAAWIASKGGTMPGARRPATPDSTAATQLSPTNVPAAAAPQPATGTPRNAAPAAPAANNPDVANRATQNN
jgi:cytochrome c oxidase subunit II